MNTRKRWTAWCRVLMLVVLAGWLTFVPQRAEAQYAYSCADFMDDVMRWCDSYQGYICAFYCFEYVDCPIGCNDWCCPNGWGGWDCCETRSFGYAECCW